MNDVVEQDRGVGGTRWKIYKRFFCVCLCAKMTHGLLSAHTFGLVRYMYVCDHTNKSQFSHIVDLPFSKED